jgi:hypothetical protein
MKKVNLSNFNKPELIARLYVIQKNFSFKSEELLNDRIELLNYVETIAKANFVYPKSHQERVKCNLALFLLGNPDNVFDKAII